MGQALNYHYAAEGVSIGPNDLFRRETYRFIKRNVGKQPLDVGADRIARTAHAALKVIEELRLLTSKPI